MVSLQPDVDPGDVIIILTQIEHKKFVRNGEDLYYKHTLGLTEALCGFEMVLKHLDKRQLLIKSEPGEVFRPGKYNPLFNDFTKVLLKIL